MTAKYEPHFTIGKVSAMLSIPQRLIRDYEAKGLITPARKGSWRYYTTSDVRWLGCLREMSQHHGVSAAVLKKLLRYTPCWYIADCPAQKRQHCSAFLSNSQIPKRIVRNTSRPDTLLPKSK